MLYSGSFVVLHPTSRSVTHLELVFVEVRCLCLGLSFARRGQLFQLCLLEGPPLFCGVAFRLVSEMT